MRKHCSLDVNSENKIQIKICHHVNTGKEQEKEH